MKALLSFCVLSAAPAFAQDPASASLEAQTRVAQLHYRAAIEEIEAADPGGLTPAQCAERARLMDELRAYVERADFGRNELFPGARMPHFVDREGRRCAVAELLYQSELDALVDEVASQANHAWVCELAHDQRFQAWLTRSGLTLSEAARIQGPPNITSPSGFTGSGEKYTGPGDTVSGGGSGASSAPAAPSAPTGGRSGGAPAAPAAPPTTGFTRASSARPTTVSLATTSDDGWWLWWEYNKVEFLRPNRLDFSHVPATGDDPAGTLRRAAETARAQVLPLFVEGLADPSAEVRAAATIALGRSGGHDAVAELLPRLNDAHLAVRERAILALAATDSVVAAGALLSIARHGALDVQGKQRIAPTARALAIVALGLMRANGLEPSIDASIVKLVRERSGAERDSIAVAALVYQTLAPNPALERVALELAYDESESPSVRCRAAEALRSAADEATLGRLQHLLNGPRLDLRRSAALALGSFENELALPALQTAFEFEAEPLTRGFILTSIGRRGTPEARAFLEKQLKYGKSGVRRWAALALGLWSRASGDRSVAASIREAQAREKDHDVFGAYWIALGLARDERSVPALARALSEAGNPRERMYASSALALVGGETAHAILLDALAREPQASVRVIIAQSVGIFGLPQDAAALGNVLAGVRDVELQAQISSAVAMHGTPEALAALRASVGDESDSSVRHAATLEGLGMLLSHSTPLRLGDVSRQANYTVFSEWVNGMFQTTL